MQTGFQLITLKKGLRNMCKQKGFKHDHGTKMPINLRDCVIVKASDSKNYKHDHGKLRYDLITPRMLEVLAQVLTYGAEKYEPNSWQKVENGLQRYEAALFRHIQAFRKGEMLDEESGLPHMAHATTNALFLLELSEGEQ